MPTRLAFMGVQQFFPKNKRNKQIPAKEEISAVSAYLSWESTDFKLLRLLEKMILNNRNVTSF